MWWRVGCRVASLLALWVAIVAGGPATAADGVAFLQPSTQVVGSRRVALVIGNGAYAHVPSLRNTVSDADAIATKLRGLGYEIEYAQNVDRRAMNEAITAFLDRVGPGMQATIYYAGHGVELNGANYLLPTDIPALDPDQERMLRTEGVNVNDLLLDVTDRHAAVTLVILDACRDNPFHMAGTYGSYRSLGATRGLATVAPPRGSFVIFSAGAGEEALDNLGSADASPNGLFTRKLLALMDKDGLELRELVRELRVEVSDAAATTPDHHSQVPGYYDQMLGDFYFRPGKNAVSLTLPEPSPVVQQSTEPPVGVKQTIPLPPTSPPPPSPQKWAYGYAAPENNPAPICPPGEIRRDGVCQAQACGTGKSRNRLGMCVAHRPLSAPRRHVGVVQPPPLAKHAERTERAVPHRPSHSGGCVKVGSQTYC